MQWFEVRGTLLWCIACVAGAGLAGCGPVELRKPVTVVRTSTPGLAYVLIQPITRRDRDAPPSKLEETDRDSDYILLCDGRRGDGMRCTVAAETSHARFSEHRVIVKAGTSFHVGTAAGSATAGKTGAAKEPVAAAGPAPQTAPLAPAGGR